ncbi:MAG: multi-sensor signal transduction histidine kinase, partial [Deltaproteobacteria bacterium]|nr:multi-sensor signal transduction histidine kinase [Deltaproteobacteria bacterium]
MADQSKTIQGLTAENDVLKKRIRELEAVEVDRKRAEEALRHAANMWQATFDSLECAIWLLDKDMRIVAANRGTQMVLNRDPKEILGRHCWELVHGTQQPIAECPVVRSQRTRRRESMELQQGMQCFEVTADPVLDETAGIAGTVHVITDITGRKTTDEEMRKSRMITENIPVGLYLYHLEDVSDDRTLRMMYANPAVKALTGLGPEDVVGRTLDENFPGLRAQGIPQRYAEVVRSQTAITYEDMNYEDNRVLRASFSVRAFPLPGNHVGVIFENITERKRAEEVLRKSEEKYRILIETTDTGYVFIDENGFVLDANKEYVRISGHGNLNEILGRSVLEWTAEVDKAKNVLAVKSCFEKGFIRDFEIHYTDQKGNLTPIEINATCLSVAEKKQTITLCRDITDRKQAEDALKKLSLRQEALLTAIPDILMEVDANKVYSWANP